MKGRKVTKVTLRQGDFPFPSPGMRRVPPHAPTRGERVARRISVELASGFDPRYPSSLPGHFSHRCRTGDPKNGLTRASHFPPPGYNPVCGGRNAAPPIRRFRSVAYDDRHEEAGVPLANLPPECRRRDAASGFMRSRARTFRRGPYQSGRDVGQPSSSEELTLAGGPASHRKKRPTRLPHRPLPPARNTRVRRRAPRPCRSPDRAAHSRGPRPSRYNCRRCTPAPASS